MAASARGEADTGHSPALLELACWIEHHLAAHKRHHARPRTFQPS